jgi:hypothetical protein
MWFRISFMLETLYKTSTPEEGKSECYELSLKMLPGISAHRHYVREDHGWWDDSTKTFIHYVETLNTAAEGVTSEEAEEIYRKARTNRANSGFVHSFSPFWPSGYQLIEAI